ncbi:MAG: S41 family peptidase [Eubacteriales bacterium]|nr:S41 family peptidase [Eubacteriales bacterium]
MFAPVLCHTTWGVTTPRPRRLPRPGCCRLYKALRREVPMQLTKKQFWLFIASLLLVAALTFGLTFVFTRQAKPEPEIRYVPVEYPAVDGVPDRYRELCALLRLYSYYGLPEDTDFDGLLARAIVAATKDPYAEYFTAAEYAEYRADLSGEFYGIGVTVDSFETADDAPAIRLLDVFTGSGAMAAGLQKGDLIVAVDGTSLTDLGGANAALDRIRGEEGTTVTLTVLRDGKTADYPVTRGDCTKKTIYTARVPLSGGRTAAYIRITAFNTVTLREFVDAVAAAENAGVSGLLFDLRYNGGGYLDTVAQMLAYLLPDGDISHIRYRSEALKDYDIRAKDGKMTGASATLTAEEIAHAVTLPMAVLVNGSTASASELFTSALRDYAANDEAYPDFPDVTIVGSNTYGKGCLQTARSLSDGSYLKMTVGLYDPPFGENYHGVGIAPTAGYNTEKEATDKRVGDLYLKATEGSTTLPDGSQDVTLVRALDALNAHFN